MRIVFVHGGGDNAHAVDREIASALSNALGSSEPIDYPRVEGLEQIDWKKTQEQLVNVLRTAAEGTTLVAHSLGASAALKLLTDGVSTKITNAILLAAPYKGADSHWGIDEFTFRDDFAGHLPSDLDLVMYHCEDDEVIPVEDAIDYRNKLPETSISLLKTGGHQFEGRIDLLAGHIRRLTGA